MNIVWSAIFTCSLFAALSFGSSVFCEMDVKKEWDVVMYTCDGTCNPNGDCIWTLDDEPDPITGSPRMSCECPEGDQPGRGCRTWLVNPSGGSSIKTGDYHYCEKVNCTKDCAPRTTFTATFQSACLCPP